MNRNILFVLFLLLLCTLQIREGFREGQIDPRVSKKQLDSCKAAKNFWDKRDKNTIFATMAGKLGFLCTLPPCRGGPQNDWKCQPPPPPPKSTSAQKKSCDAARTFWGRRSQNKMMGGMALNVGKDCMKPPCSGSPSNDWRCKDDPAPAKSGAPKKSTKEQRASCKAARSIWAKRLNKTGNARLMMQNMALRMGAPCMAKPCEGGPANDWRCQDAKEGMTDQSPCSDKEQKEITRLENRLKAAKNRCSNNSASAELENFRGMREGFREGQEAAADAAAAAAAAAAARAQRARLAANARAQAAARAAQQQRQAVARARAAENARRARFSARERRLDADARRAPKATPEQLKSCADAAAACTTNCTPLRQGAIARGVGRACTSSPCYGGPQNNWKCITSLDNRMRVEGPTGAQQNSCTAARGFFAKRNEDPAMLARAMSIGRACNACGGNTQNNYTCTSTRQATAERVRTAGATAPSATAVTAAGAGSARCAKCDVSAIVKNLGDQYKNDPNICKTRKDEAQCSDAGGLWDDEVASNTKKNDQGTGDWRVEIDEKTGDLAFNYKGQTKSKLTKTGEWSSDSRKCGTWNIRKNSIGIPGRGDIHLHTDGWFRAFNYDDEAIQIQSHNPGGFAGRELWYGGSGGGKLTK